MSRRVPVLSGLLFLAVVSVYLANGRTIGSGDTLPTRYLPFSLLREGNADLDEFPALYDAGARRIFPTLDGIPYFVQHRGGHYVSAYSPGPALVALPVYAWAALSGAAVEPAGAVLEKVSAAAITALSVVLLFWALGPLVSMRWALGLAAVYAFGTTSWSVTSQALWQHGPSQLFLGLLLVCLVRGRSDERWLGYAGLAASAAAVMRSTDVLLTAPVLVWVLYTRPRVRLRLVLWALPPLAALLAYNVVYFGPGAGPAEGTTAPPWAFFTQASPLAGLGGLLLSPARGLLVYSPVLAFALVGLVRVLVSGPTMPRLLALGVVLELVVVSHWFRWWGGHVWGPRLLADTTPVLCFLLYPLTDALDRRRAVKALFLLLAAGSVLVHGLGAFLYDGRWDVLVDADRHPRALWSWRASPLVFYGREAAAAVERLRRVGTGGRPTSVDAPALLGASYRAEPVPGEAIAGGAIPVALAARNTGQAVWLAAAPGDKGAVRLGWRWSRDGADVESGRALLPDDVVPGRTARFTETVPVPAAPGDYTLTLDLVSELVTWFAGQGARPVAAPVRVRPLDLERLLSAPLDAKRSPTASISSDRASYGGHDTIHLTVRLVNPHRPGQYDGYLVGKSAAGAVWFFDGQQAFSLAEHGWVAWSRRLPMPGEATGRFTLPAATIGPGVYRWYAILAEAGLDRAAARGDTTFTVAP